MMGYEHCVESYYEEESVSENGKKKQTVWMLSIANNLRAVVNADPME
jgi:hypothetical protein